MEGNGWRDDFIRQAHKDVEALEMRVRNIERTLDKAWGFLLALSAVGGFVGWAIGQVLTWIASRISGS